MSDSDPRNSSERPRPGNNGNGGEPQFNWRALLLLAMAAALIGGAFMYRSPGGAILDVPYSKFHKAVANNWVDRNKPLELVSEAGAINDHIQGWAKFEEGGPSEHFRTQVNLQYNSNLRDFLQEHELEANPRADTNVMASTIMSFLPVAMFL
ncbi:MAG: hypothetical protein WCL08_00885, partial [Verrucomicrobiota bacterium]